MWCIVLVPSWSPASDSKSGAPNRGVGGSSGCGCAGGGSGGGAAGHWEDAAGKSRRGAGGWGSRGRGLRFGSPPAVPSGDVGAPAAAGASVGASSGTGCCAGGGDAVFARGGLGGGVPEAADSPMSAKLSATSNHSVSCACPRETGAAGLWRFGVGSPCAAGAGAIGAGGAKDAPRTRWWRQGGIAGGPVERGLELLALVHVSAPQLSRCAGTSPRGFPHPFN